MQRLGEGVNKNQASEFEAAIAERPCDPAIITRAYLKSVTTISGCTFSHLRILSESETYFAMVDSIGPYSSIGWSRRFRIIDERNIEDIAYQVCDLADFADCRNLAVKHSHIEEYRTYLESIRYGVWVPIYVSGYLYGYTALHWANRKPTCEDIALIRSYMENVEKYLCILVSCARSVAYSNFDNKLFAHLHKVTTASYSEDILEVFGDACARIWGTSVTCYVGRYNDGTNTIDVESFHGCHQDDVYGSDQMKVPTNIGIFGYVYGAGALLSIDVAGDRRFSYHSLLAANYCPGSAIGARIVDASGSIVHSVVSVESDVLAYFDVYDFEVLKRLCNVVSGLVSSREEEFRSRAQEMDLMMTEIAHEVVEPLQSLMDDADIVKYFAEVSASGADMSEIVTNMTSLLGNADSIMDVVSTLDAVVKRILDQSTEANGTAEVLTVVNLRRTLISLINKLSPRAATRAITFEHEIGQLASVNVKVNQADLEVALRQLMNNAVKYSYSGSALDPRTVNIIGKVRPGWVTVEITNYGVGIKPNEISKIGKRFYRGELARAEGRAGTGRGFTRASEIVRGFGGKIEVYSKYAGERNYPNGPWFTAVTVHIPIEEE